MHTEQSNIPAVTAKLLQKLIAMAQRAVAELEARFEAAIAEGKPLPIRELTQALAALERTLKLHKLLEKTNAQTTVAPNVPAPTTDAAPPDTNPTRPIPPCPPHQIATNSPQPPANGASPTTLQPKSAQFNPTPTLQQQPRGANNNPVKQSTPALNVAH